MPGNLGQLVLSALIVSALTVATPAPAAHPAGPSASSSTGSSNTPGSPLPSVRLPLPSATVPTQPVDVLPPLPVSGPVPTPAGLGRVVGPLLRRPGLGSSVSAEVIDVATGTSLFVRDAARPAAPASAAKVLTAAATLTALGPDATLPTRAVRGALPGEVVLVGGGDVLLAPGRGDPGAVAGHAGLADLANATAASLRAGGTTTIAVRLDDSLFSGPAVNPAWLPGDVTSGFVAPVMAVEVTAGTRQPGRTLEPGMPAPRVADPALTTARRFAALLARRGITVTGSVVRAKAPPQATVLGEVRSATIADIVEFDLTNSDNTTAEALARLVAVAVGRPATFADGGRAVLEQIARLQVPTTDARMPGGSGLGRGTAVGADTLARTLALAGSPAETRLRAVLSGLPVAGASGTLADRFAGPGLARGIGVVRAKTGTLTGVSSLAGTVVDADGRLLAFAVIADGVPVTASGRAALDAFATALAGCGCR